ncbi:MAG: ABC transporter permease [Thermoclostridium sp.]|nr:ABC transporter permease [Thermoclostridium sp.]
MQVFKLCMNIIKKNLGILIIYVIVFLTVSLIMSANMNQDLQKVAAFNQDKTNIAFISEEDSTLIDGFKEELGKIANFVELPDKTEQLQDALFFRSVTYILRVPKGFTESFMSGQEIQLEKTILPDSFSNMYIDLCIDKYFNTARVYITSLESITQEELVAHLKADLAESALVETKTNGEKKVSNSTANYFYNYLSYSLLSVIILGMSALMLVFNNRDLKLRNGCSPIPATSMNLQFVLGNLVFTFASWLLMILLCFVVNFKNSFNLNTVYFILNSFVFALCSASISYLIGNLIKSPNAASMICNVVALGLSFISGTFVPQELLGGPVLKIASFGPSYWFIKANNAIAELSQFDYTHLKPIFSDMLILICFTVAFFSVALVIGKKRRYA